MSLKIIKSGLLDTVQDRGRFGFQHQGINPGGAMDRFSAQLANALLGKQLSAPVMEMHYPAPQILFTKKAIFCLAGADFGPVLNGKEIALHQPVAVDAGAVLSFRQRKKGARCYLSVFPEWQLEPWLNSYSTNLKAGVGGYHGRRLEKEDELPFAAMNFFLEKEPVPLPWKYGAEENSTTNVAFVPGPEWDWLNTKNQTLFLNNAFRITPTSDRMGYRLQSERLEPEKKEQLLSSAVNFGTVQLLPNGQLIVLMADHQTTGGYPRIANVSRAHLPKLAQCNAGEDIRFAMTNAEAAEAGWVAQQKLLQHLQSTCQVNIQNWLQHHSQYKK